MNIHSWYLIVLSYSRLYIKITSTGVEPERRYNAKYYNPSYKGPEAL